MGPLPHSDWQVPCLTSMDEGTSADKRSSANGAPSAIQPGETHTSRMIFGADAVRRAREAEARNGAMRDGNGYYAETFCDGGGRREEKTITGIIATNVIGNRIPFTGTVCMLLNTGTWYLVPVHEGGVPGTGTAVQYGILIP